METRCASAWMQQQNKHKTGLEGRAGLAANRACSALWPSSAVAVVLMCGCQGEPTPRSRLSLHHPKAARTQLCYGRPAAKTSECKHRGGLHYLSHHRCRASDIITAIPSTDRCTTRGTRRPRSQLYIDLPPHNCSALARFALSSQADVPRVSPDTCGRK